MAANFPEYSNNYYVNDATCCSIDLNNHNCSEYVVGQIDLLAVVKCKNHNFNKHNVGTFTNKYVCIKCGVRAWFQLYKLGYHLVTWKENNKPCVKR